MKYQNVLDRVRSGSLSRTQLLQIQENARAKVDEGEQEAQIVIDAINLASPPDAEIVFMGFCPGADINNRLDVEWKERGICTFEFDESEQQVKRFSEIWSGDLVVLKKRHRFGKSMQLFGHGRVSGIKYSNEGRRVLEMAWSAQEHVIEVPLMGCNSTVDVRTMERVQQEMPEEFFEWLTSN